MAPEPPPNRSRPATALAWAVHAFTASGAVLAILALMAIQAGDWRLALIWLGIALIVDGVDGTLARRARVKELTPRIDGSALDLIIDYLNYVFVPTALMWRAGLLPEDWAPGLAAVIQLSALYVFARADMKTPDNYFRGFPALWNVVALYLYAAQPGVETGAAVVLVLAVLSFAPIHFVHPFRVRDYGRWLPALVILWAAATGALLWPDWAPVTRGLLLWTSSASAMLLVLLGLIRTLRGPRREADGPSRRGT